MNTRQISATDVLPLRHEVLRPGKPRETAIFAGDTAPGTSHWGAFDELGNLRAVATLLSAPKPGTTGPAWQVRGMASSPLVRGQGYGAAVLRAIVETVRSHPRGGPNAVIWCNARVAALDFYRAQGFETEGPQFEILEVGPHFVMWRRA